MPMGLCRLQPAWRQHTCIAQCMRGTSMHHSRADLRALAQRSRANPEHLMALEWRASGRGSERAMTVKVCDPDLAPRRHTCC